MAKNNVNKSGTKKEEEEKKKNRRNLASLTKRLEGFEENTVRRYFDQLLLLFGIEKEKLKDEHGRIWFDPGLEDYLVWVYKHIDCTFLKNSLRGEPTTLEDALEFQEAMLEYVNTLEELDKSLMLKIADDLTLQNSKLLFQKTLQKAKTLAQLFEQLPPRDRIELLEKLNVNMDLWIDDLNKNIPTN